LPPWTILVDGGGTIRSLNAPAKAAGLFICAITISQFHFPDFLFLFLVDLFITVHGNGFTRASASP
jgi:hypothetical protein